jgi:hypothetical protein
VSDTPRVRDIAFPVRAAGAPRVDQVVVTLLDGRRGKGKTVFAAIRDAQRKAMRHAASSSKSRVESEKA